MGSMGGEIQSGGHPCAVTQWNPWGSCSKQCGQGIKRRRREFIDPRAAQSYSCNDKLYEDALCEGNNCNDQDQVRVYKQAAKLQNYLYLMRSVMLGNSWL